MKLYLVENISNNGWDTYDSMVVAAENADAARKMHPSEFVTHIANGRWKGTTIHGEEYDTGDREWVKYEEINDLIVEEIGKTDIAKCIVLASFNAG